MKLLIAAFLLSGTAGATSTPSISEAANEVVTATKMLQPSIDALNSTAAVVGKSPEEAVEKDLGLCLMIGNSGESSGSLAVKALGLMSENFSNADQKELDQLAWDVSKLRGALMQYCVANDLGQYRVVSFLTAKLSELQQKSARLRAIAETYDPHP